MQQANTSDRNDNNYFAELSNRSKQELLLKNIDFNDPIYQKAALKLGLSLNDLLIQPRESFGKI